MYFIKVLFHINFIFKNFIIDFIFSEEFFTKTTFITVEIMQRDRYIWSGQVFYETLEFSLLRLSGLVINFFFLVLIKLVSVKYNYYLNKKNFS